MGCCRASPPHLSACWCLKAAARHVACQHAQPQHSSGLPSQRYQPQCTAWPNTAVQHHTPTCASLSAFSLANILACTACCAAASWACLSEAACTSARSACLCSSACLRCCWWRSTCWCRCARCAAAGAGRGGHAGVSHGLMEASGMLASGAACLDHEGSTAAPVERQRR